MPSSKEPARCSVCISIVTYRIVPVELNALLASLQVACEQAREQLGVALDTVLVDNGQEPAVLEALCAPYRQSLGIRFVFNAHNRGYGRAHNQVIRGSQADFHLLMNPDVVLKPDALLRALRYLQRNPEVVALSPEVRDIDGRCQYLCKRYPTVLDLLLRGLAPTALRRRFDKRLALYECRNMVDRKLTAQAHLISGCFMLCRTSALQQVGGFDEQYFLYFEDFALSIELGKHGKLVYFPDARIVHYGGHAARKGWKHIRYFAQSAHIFFSHYGWKLR
jgi:GT2 family glycosyltransferase